jgi:hypothetical protein
MLLYRRRTARRVAPRISCCNWNNDYVLVTVDTLSRCNGLISVSTREHSPCLAKLCDMGKLLLKSDGSSQLNQESKPFSPLTMGRL